VPDATPESTTPTPTPTPTPTAAAQEPDPRAEDHAAIERLATDLLPALVAKLGATGLGEIEVREGTWKVRLRRPDGSGPWLGAGRRATDRPSRAQPGHEGHGHAPGALEGHRSARNPATSHSSNGSGPSPAAGRPDPAPARPDAPAEARRPAGDPHRAVATSPAVGIFQPHAPAGPGSRVRAGDRIGLVDMLGVGQEVVAPADGVVTGILVEAGDAVEYGQELVVLELMTRTSAG